MSNQAEGLPPILSNPDGISSTAELLQGLGASSNEKPSDSSIVRGIFGGLGMLGAPVAVEVIKRLLADHDQNPKYIEEWRRNNQSTTSLVFVHGFNAKRSARDDWSRGLVRYAKESHLSLYALRWGCDFEFNLLTFDPVVDAVRFISHFKEMRDLADQEARHF